MWTVLRSSLRVYIFVRRGAGAYGHITGTVWRSLWVREKGEQVGTAQLKILESGFVAIIDR